MYHAKVALLRLFLLAIPLFFVGKDSISAEIPSEELVSTARDLYKVEGFRLMLQPSGNMHWIVYNRKLSFPYEIRFEESMRPDRGSVAFLWNYNLYDAAFKKRLGTGFNQVLVVSGGKRIRYLKTLFEEKEIPFAQERRWRIVCEKSGSRIYLNDRLVARGGADRAIPSFAIQLHGMQGRRFVLRNVRITDSGRGEKRKPLLYQFPLRNDPKRVMTVFAHDALTPAQKTNMEKLPLLFTYVEEAAGAPVEHTDPIVAIYEKTASGNNLAATKGYAGWLEVGPSMLERLHLIAHEFAHFYFCVGASCGTGMDLSSGDFKNAAKAAVANNWMVEGFASYTGMVGLNRMLGRPDLHYSKEFGNYLGNEEKIRVRGWYDGPLGDGHRIKRKHVPFGETDVDVAFAQTYGKGYRFFYLLGSRFGHETIQKIIRRNMSTSREDYTAEELLEDLSRVSGRSARPYFSGWVYPGAYEKESPLSFVDENENGIIDFAEQTASSSK